MTEKTTADFQGKNIELPGKFGFKATEQRDYYQAFVTTENVFEFDQKSQTGDFKTKVTHDFGWCDPKSEKIYVFRRYPAEGVEIILMITEYNSFSCATGTQHVYKKLFKMMPTQEEVEIEINKYLFKLYSEARKQNEKQGA